MDIESSLTAIRGADNERTTRKEKGTARKVSKQRISLIIYHSTEAERFFFFFFFLLIESLTRKERFTSVRIMIKVIKFTILTAQAFRRIHSL